MKKANMRIGNIEFRTVADGLLDNGKHTTGEILQHGDSFCWTVAYWEKNNDGFHLRFVGSRPFENSVNKKDFFALAEFGQNYLSESGE